MLRAFPSKPIITKSFTIDVPINKIAAQLHLRPRFETSDDVNAKVISVNGFPRSGNTALWFLIKSAMTEDTKLLSHLHDVIDLKVQLDRGSTCIVPFRGPIDTVASLAVYRSQENNRRAIRSYFKSWIVWHKMSLKLVDYPNVHFVEFDDITKNLASILKKSFLKDFVDHGFVYVENEFRVNMEKELAIHDGQGFNSDGTPPFRTLSIPNTSRNAILNELKYQIHNDTSLGALRSKADQLYCALIGQIKS